MTTDEGKAQLLAKIEAFLADARPALQEYFRDVNLVIPRCCDCENDNDEEGEGE